MRLFSLPGTFSVTLLFSEPPKWIPGPDVPNFPALGPRHGALQGVKAPESLCPPLVHVEAWLASCVVQWTQQGLWGHLSF